VHDKGAVRRRGRGRACPKARLTEQGGGTHRWKKKAWSIEGVRIGDGRACIGDGTAHTVRRGHTWAEGRHVITLVS
jgi:hypothetical protein